MGGLLWTIFAVLLVVWLFGLILGNIGNIVHVLLILALAILAYNLLFARRTA